VFAKSRTAEQESELSKLKRSIAEEVLAKEPGDLFTIQAS
jgi:hypothetical protein